MTADGTARERPRKSRQTAIGIVTSAHKTPKTLRVEVPYLVRHRTYGKFIRRSTVLHVHDEKGEAKLGDRVQLAPCRPMSKTKSWRLVKVLEAAPQE